MNHYGPLGFACSFFGGLARSVWFGSYKSNSLGETGGKKKRKMKKETVMGIFFIFYFYFYLCPPVYDPRRQKEMK